MKVLAVLLAMIMMMGVISLPTNDRSHEIPWIDERPEGWWLHFYRDSNRNGVDDLIDSVLARGKNQVFSQVVISLSRPVTEDDIRFLEDRGFDVVYAARYFPAIVLKDVKARDVHALVKMDGIVLIEVPPELRYSLDVSVPAIKARESGQYSPYTARELGYAGSGVNIAIMDSGVNDQIPTGHVMVDDMDDDDTTFDPKFIAGCEAASGVAVGGSAVNPETSDAMHGTHVAGIALGTGSDYQGVAPGSRLIDVHVGTLTNLNYAGVLSAIDWIIANNETDWENDGPANNGVPVVSMSFGGQHTNGQDTLAQAVNSMVEHGCIAVVAIGNDGPNNNGISTPGSADRAITIGAVDDHGTIDRSDDSIASMSARGPREDDGDSDPYDEMKPDVVSPGIAIMSALAWSKTALVSESGTSMATPHISGVVALMLEANPDLRPRAPDYEMPIKQILHDTAEDRNGADRPSLSEKWDRAYGWGIVDAYGAVKRAEDLTKTSMKGPAIVDSRTEGVEFSASLPLTRTPYTIEDDITEFSVRVPRSWSRPYDIEISSTGGVEYTTSVSAITSQGDYWVFTAKATHKEDIDRYQECIVNVKFRSDAPAVNFDTDFTFKLKATQNGVRAWPAEHTVTVQATPYLVYVNKSIDDDNQGASSGNGDGEVNPGESIEMNVLIRNKGARTAYEVVGTLWDDSPYVDITDEDADFGSIPPGQEKWSLNDFNFDVSSEAPVGHLVTFIINLTDRFDRHWSDTFQLEIGGVDHDLAVTDFEAPERVETGQEVEVNAIVKNLGVRDEEGVDVRLLVNGTGVNSTTVEYIGSGDSVQVSLSWTPDSPGNYTLTARVDPVEGETAVDNNEMNRSIVVYRARGYVLVDDVYGETSDHSDYLNALMDEGFEIRYASDLGFDLEAFLHHVLVISLSPIYDDPQVRDLQDYVRLGGGLILIADDKPEAYQRLTGELGINWSSRAGKMNDTTDQIRNHPVTRNVTALFFRAPQASLIEAEADPLAYDSSGDVLLACVAHSGEGHVLAVSDDDFLNNETLNRDDNRIFGINAAKYLRMQRKEHDVGVARLYAPEFVEPGEVFDLSASIINLGLSDEPQIDVEVVVNGTTVDNASVGLEPGEWHNTSFSIILNDEGWYEIEVRALLNSDDALENNLATCTVEVFNGSGIIGIDVYHGNRTDHRRFLDHLRDLGFDFIEIDHEMRYEDLANLSLILAIEPDVKYEDEEIAAVQDFVRSGKGIMIISTIDTDVPDLLNLNVTWNDSMGEEGTTDHISTHQITKRVHSLYLAEPYSSLNGVELFRDYRNETVHGALSDYGEGRTVGIASALLSDDYLDKDDNRRLGRQAVGWLRFVPPETDVAVVNLSAPMFVEWNTTAHIRALVHCLGGPVDAYVDLLVDGEVVNTRVVSLERGEIRDVEFDYTPTRNGTHDIVIRSRADGDERPENDRAMGEIEVLRILFENHGDLGMNSTGLWHLTNRTYRSPHSSWWYGDENKDNYDVGSGEGVLTSDEISLLSIRSARLVFRHRMDCDNQADFGEVNLSADGEWMTLMTFRNTTDRWEMVEIPLTGYENRPVRIAFRFSHDDRDNAHQGWFIDDLYLVGYVNITPVTEFVEPENGSVISGTVDVIVHARDDDGIESVEYRINVSEWKEMDLRYGSEQDGNWNATLDTRTMDDGVFTLEARSTNATGYVRRAWINVTIDNTPPWVNVTSPAEMELVSDYVWINATVKDAESGVSSVKYRVLEDWRLLTRSGDNYTALWNSSEVDDGEVNITIRAEDRAGNVAVVSIQVCVDNTPPMLLDHHPGHGEWVNGTISVNATWTDMSGISSAGFIVDKTRTINMTLRSGDVRNGTWCVEWNTTETDDGWHNLTLNAMDNASNVASVVFRVYVNNVDDPPSVRIIMPVDGSVIGGSVKIVANATDEEGLKRVEFRVDAGDWLPMTEEDGNHTASWDSLDVEDGEHVLEVRAVDTSDQSSVDSVSLIVDNTPPEIRIIEPSGFVKEVVAIDVDVIDANPHNVSYSVDGSSWIELSGGESWNTTSYEDGNHTLRFRAYDQAGNMGDNETVVVVDNTWPFVEIISPDLDATVSATVRVVARVLDEHIGAVQFRYNGQWVNMTQDGDNYTAQWDTTEVADGEHSVLVRCVDLAGNEGMDSIDVEVDNVDDPPHVEILTPIEDEVVGLYVLIVANVTDDRGLENVSFRSSGSGWQAMTGEDGNYRSEWNTSSLEGSVTLEVMALDTGGNRAYDSVEVIVDNTPPEFRDFDPEDGTVVDEDVNLSVKVFDDHLDMVQVLLPGSTVWKNMKVHGSRHYYVWKVDSLKDSRYTVWYRALDMAENLMYMSLNFTLDRKPPFVDISHLDREVTGHVRIDAAVVDLSTTVVEFYVDGTYEAEMRRHGSLWRTTWSSFLVEDGDHMIGVRAVDALGREGWSNTTIRTNNVNDPPDLSLYLPPDPLMGIVTITASVTDDFGSASAEFTVDGENWYDMKLVSGDEKQGTWSAEWNTSLIGEDVLTLTVKVTDMNGSTVSRSREVTVDNLPPVIFVKSPENGTSVSGNVRFRVRVRDISIRRVECDVGDGWRPMEPQNHLFVFKWNSTGVNDGKHVVSFRAYDALDRMTQITINVIVDNTNEMPDVNIISPKGRISGVVQVIARVTDDRGVQTVNLTAGSIFLVMYPADNNTWAAELDTTTLPDGTYKIVVTCIDTDGATASDWLYVDVDNLPEPIYWIELNATETEFDLKAGMRYIVLEVTNRGNVPAEVEIRTEIPLGWGADPEYTTVNLQPGMSKIVYISIYVPEDASPKKIVVTATYQNSTDKVVFTFSPGAEGKEKGMPYSSVMGAVAIIVLVLLILGIWRGWIPVRTFLRRTADMGDTPAVEPEFERVRDSDSTEVEDAEVTEEIGEAGD